MLAHLVNCAIGSLWVPILGLIFVISFLSGLKRFGVGVSIGKLSGLIFIGSWLYSTLVYMFAGFIYDDIIHTVLRTIIPFGILFWLISFTVRNKKANKNHVNSSECADGLAKKQNEKTPNTAKNISIPTKAPLIKESRPPKTFITNNQNSGSTPEGGHEGSKENDGFHFKAELERRVYGYLLKEEKDEATMLQARVMCDGNIKKAETIYYKLRCRQIVESGEIDKFKEAILAEKPRRIILRSQPHDVSEGDLENMVMKYNFFHKTLNSIGLFKNDFVDNGNNTVTDKSTSLMWQKGGASNEVTYDEAKLFIANINEKQYLGYSDWRIPTIEELSSLIKRPKEIGRKIFIDQVFENKQVECWSSDSKDKIYVWFVKFNTGSIFWSSGDLNYYIKAVRSIT